MAHAYLPMPDDDWFVNCFGFDEHDNNYRATQSMLLQMQEASSDPSRKLRLPNSTTEVTFGSFVLPTVAELRHACAALHQQLQRFGDEDQPYRTKLVAWRNVVDSVLNLHAGHDHGPVIFQAASQFNCLEFPSPETTPEEGITNYCYDHTQGPACAMACGPGTAFRNYLVPWSTVEGTPLVGQSRRDQINTLQPILDQLTLCNGGERVPITVKNGYAEASSKQLQSVAAMVNAQAADLVSRLQVGIQRDTQVTYPANIVAEQRLVTQVYCSAVPVSYTSATPDDWEPLAKIVLQGAYEATLLEGVRQGLAVTLQEKEQQSSTFTARFLVPKVYLTLVGGGVFGNKHEWIYDAMVHAHAAVQSYGMPLDVYIVHYSDVPHHAQALVQHLNNTAPMSV